MNRIRRWWLRFRRAVEQPRVEPEPTPTPEPVPESPPPIAAIYDGFESGNLDRWKQQANPGRLTVVKTTKAREGAHVLRVEVRKDEPQIAGGHRSEIFRLDGMGYWQDGTDIWVGGSVMFPEDYQDDPAQEIIWQVHGKDTVPFLIQSVGPDLIIKGRTLAPTTIPKTKGKWMDIVCHYLWQQRHGRIFVYVDEVAVAHGYGLTIREGEQLYQKFGLYKSGWKGSGSTTTQRVLYYDAIRFGDSFDAVRPR